MSPDAFPPDPAPEPAPETAPEPEVPTPAPRFDVEPYRPRWTAPVLGTLLTFAGLAAAAAGIGYLVHLVQPYAYWVLIFPMAMGLLLGVAGVGLVRAFKLRNPVLLGLAALAGGVLTIGSVHYFDYLRALEHLRQQPPAVRAIWEPLLSNFVKFVEDNADKGVELGRRRQQGMNRQQGVNLGYYGSYAYWAAEMVVVGLIAFALMNLAARAPLCDRCGAWKQRRVAGVLDTPFPDRATQALQEGEVLRLLQGVAPRGTEGLMLKLSACRSCGAEAPVDVALELHTKGDKGQMQVKELAHYTYPGEMLRFLDGPRGPA